MKKIVIVIGLVILAAVLFISITRGDSGNVANVLDSQDRTTLYKNQSYGFSFHKPEGYTVGEFEQDDGADTVVVQSSTAGDVKKGFQILIMPFDEPEAVITKERIGRDIPDMKVENEKEVSLGDTPGLEFQSDNLAFDGASVEVWFVREGNLYQISGYRESQSTIEEVLMTWKW